MASGFDPIELGDTPTDARMSGERCEPTRREFLQVLIGGSTLMIGGVFLTREAEAGPGPGNTSDQVDLGDSLVAVEQDYKYNLTLEVTSHNRVRFELPRQDKGQGIATALAIMIAEEMGADYDRVDVELSNRRADRPTTITGGSSTIRTMWEPARTVAANARQALIAAAAARWQVDPTTLIVHKSMVGEGTIERDQNDKPVYVFTTPGGRRANFGELSGEAAYIAARSQPVAPIPLKPLADHTIIGTEKRRKNARAIVTGAQKYTMDLRPGDFPDFPANAAPAVVARPPDIKGYVGETWTDHSSGGIAYLKIPLPDRAPVETGATFPTPTGIAVVAMEPGATFHDVLVARDALYDSIDWEPGPMSPTGPDEPGISDGDIEDTLGSITPAPAAGPGDVALEATFDFPFVAHAPLEVMNAVADVRTNPLTQLPESATIWYPSQTPNYQAKQIADAIGIPEIGVTMHVPFAGGAFGRHLFGESAIEAALISKAVGRPIRLMWPRNDDMKHGRFRPRTHHRLRATWTNADGVMRSWEHQIGAVEMDLRHGYGDVLGSGITLTHPQTEQLAFGGTVSVPYEFGDTRQELHNPSPRFEVPTGSWRAIYSGFTMAANEIFVDRLAQALGMDEVAFRLANLPSSTIPGTQAARQAARRCLEKVVEMAGLPGEPLGPNMGVALHAEYRSAVAYLVEIDATDPADPRLVRAFAAVDVGVPINPLGLKAQIQGALIDGWSVMISAANHLVDGAIDEGSYSDFKWARMNKAPLTVDVYVFSKEETGRDTPGGAGELGLPPGSAACVNAYSRATGWPNGNAYRFPILEFPELLP